MAKQELIKYIKRVKKAGYNDDQIKKALRNKGWDDLNINEAFAEIKGNIPDVPYKNLDSVFRKKTSLKRILTMF